MEQKEIQYRAFTVQWNGPMRALKTDAWIEYNGNQLKVVGLWDTGATSTCISYDVVSKLNLVSTGKTRIQTPSGSKEVNTYLLDVILPNKVAIRDVPVLDSDIGAQGLGLLVGMDIIALGDFTVTNVERKTCFTFRIPSKQKVDYVKQIAASNTIGQKHGRGRRR